MSVKPAIRVENLSKRYVIGQNRRGGYRTLRESLTDAVKAPFRAFSGQKAPAPDPFWALKDVSFEVQPGEVVGIIGRNGAGKSTLLKILSRITEPTGGRVEVRGRMGSLLEVGTGFHAELTGRENIYLNGSILGMTRREITKKFDEIVAFSEVEKFLDTPVKRYSSGMYVRLAFAVAAYLEPEILIVDEVLAVGDAAFQAKCLGRMRQISHEGVTVLLVSHQPAALRSLCSQCVLLEGGRIGIVGPTAEVLEYYAGRNHDDSITSERTFPQPHGLDVWMERAKIINLSSGSTGPVSYGDELAIDVDFRRLASGSLFGLGVIIETQDQYRLISVNTQYQEVSPPVGKELEGRIRCRLGRIPLFAGVYFITLWVLDSTGVRIPHLEKAGLQFQVQERDIWGRGLLPATFSSQMWWDASFEFLGGQGGSQ